ncbi:MAG: hypothetical protein ACK5LC_11710 [Coprobacillaceae bacterium]
MEWYEIGILVIAALNAAYLGYQIFKMAELDARSRGLKNPKLWGFLVTGGQNGGGLLLYLLGRRKYPSTMSDAEKKHIDYRKNRIGISLIFITILMLCLITIVVFK